MGVYVNQTYKPAELQQAVDVLAVALGQQPAVRDMAEQANDILKTLHKAGYRIVKTGKQS